MQKKPKIGVLIPEFPGQTHAFFWREIIAMEEAGSGVCIFSTRQPASDTCPHAFAEAARARTVYLFPPSLAALMLLVTRPVRTIHAAGYLLGLRETGIAGRLKLLALLPSAADLVRVMHKDRLTHLHIHSCANAAHLGALARILGDIPYSLTLHGDLPVYGTDHRSKMMHARFVSAVTHPLAGQIKEILPEQTAPVIWMGVNTEIFRPAPVADKQGAPFTFVTIARLNRMKGHRFFLQAMAQLRDTLPDLRYVIIGDGPERETIKAEIARLGLSDQVEMTGSLGEEDVLSRLQTADALALTSIGRGEAAPVTVMEGMACGLPVICSVIGGTPDMIETGKDGLLVAQEDVDGIAKAIKELVTDQVMRDRISTAARQTALEKFSHHTNARMLLDRINTA